MKLQCISLARTRVLLVLGCFLFTSCGGGGNQSSTDETASTSTVTATPLLITSSNFKSVVNSYEALEITFSANYDCTFTLEGDNIHWVSTTDNKTFSYRAPIAVRNNVEHTFYVSTISAASCPNGTEDFTHNVLKGQDRLKFNPATSPINEDDLKTSYFAAHNLGFGGFTVTERYSATFCYPTPDNCTTSENELFGQDAHNMATGDFNGDGFEDLVVAYALFPHILEPSMKVNAPIHIYLNDGQGNLHEDTSIYAIGEPPTHPFAYRLAIADFNGDGIDDVFAGSMGLQYRDPVDYTGYILPYPNMLLLSDSLGKFYDASSNINDGNEGKGLACNFSHDASTGDFDNDGDYDIFTCNLLLVNDGAGNFEIHQTLDFQLSHSFGNPMSSLVVDLNNDNYDDLVFWNFDNRPELDEGHVLLSNGTDAIDEWSLITIPEGPFGANHNKYNHAAWGDLNNDGNNDIVVAVTRDLPYYEGSYIQILMGDGEGNLSDQTSMKLPNQVRAENHHGEGNIYLRDYNNDGYLDIFHSTRDFASNLNGAHIAINDGNGGFNSMPDTLLPKQPKANEWNDSQLFKGVPINLDNQGCLDLVSASENWSDNNAVRNYLYSLVNIKCD